MIINEDYIRTNAPAAFATQPEEGRVSDRYSFLPTTDILSILQDEGWVAHKAMQVNSRSWSKDHAKHIIRFHHEDQDIENFGVGDSIPELLLINAHNGLGGYQLRAGVFRFVCSNGMVVAENDFGTIKLRHIGFEPKQVVEASRQIIMNTSKIAEKIDTWQNTPMNERNRGDFFADAALLRWDSPDTSLVEAVGNARRSEDTGTDLWSTFNVAQENLIRGGFVNGSSGRVAREITNIKKNVDLNAQLWELASAYANN